MHMSRKMKAAMYYGIGDVRYEEVDIPEIGPGELLIKVGTALTCGTDVKTYKRGHPVLIKQIPSLFGHEYAGTIEAVGEGVEDFKVGMRVVATNSAPCGDCFYCKRDMPNLCTWLKDNLVNGAFAEYIKVPEPIVRWNTHQIPDSLSFRDAALTEPLACVVHGIEESNIRLGDTVVVIGAGPIGQMLIMLAKKNGASTVIASDLAELRRDIALKAGADIVIDPSKEDPVERVKQETAGRGADVVIEAVGIRQTWEQAVDMTRDAGTTVLFGGAASGTQFELDTGRFHYGQLTIKGVFHLKPKHVERALKLIIAGDVNTDLLITHEMPVEKIGEALEMMGAGKTMKISITL
ncbi:MAG: putative L-threonine 3-dehydrogenase [Candidatus Thorarchaeota archaeon AB_25]|nr:MAG: putative L-threonine 3-dehydrogenase [Candidatus Thorarchaeota archaeon AB_25]